MISFAALAKTPFTVSLHFSTKIGWRSIPPKEVVCCLCLRNYSRWKVSPLYQILPACCLLFTIFSYSWLINDFGMILTSKKIVICKIECFTTSFLKRLKLFVSSRSWEWLVLSLELESQPATLSKYIYKHKNRFRLSVLSMKLRDCCWRITRWLPHNVICFRRQE